jgi:hypothetical protein
MFLSPCNCANLHIHEKNSYKKCNDTLNCVNKPILCNFLKPLLLVHVWCLCPFTMQEASQVCTSQMWNGSHICHAWMWWPMNLVNIENLRTWHLSLGGRLIVVDLQCFSLTNHICRTYIWNLVTPSTWECFVNENLLDLQKLKVQLFDGKVLLEGQTMGNLMHSFIVIDNIITLILLKDEINLTREKCNIIYIYWYWQLQI